jgi:metallophosphoesterase superfamily enzyme
MEGEQSQSIRWKGEEKPVFKILIFTDNHVGFKEKHHIRGEDSFDTLEEILSIGERENVDFALQSGDLFHDLYPSHDCICKTLRIFEKHVFGEKERTFHHYPLRGEDGNSLNFLSGKGC